MGYWKLNPSLVTLIPPPYGPQQNNRFSPKPGFRGWYLILGQGILHHSTVPYPILHSYIKNKEESITVSSTIPPFVLNGGVLSWWAQSLVISSHTLEPHNISIISHCIALDPHCIPVGRDWNVILGVGIKYNMIRWYWTGLDYGYYPIIGLFNSQELFSIN